MSFMVSLSTSYSLDFLGKICIMWVSLTFLLVSVYQVDLLPVFDKWTWLFIEIGGHCPLCVALLPMQWTLNFIRVEKSNQSQASKQTHQQTLLSVLDRMDLIICLKFLPLTVEWCGTDITSEHLFFLNYCWSDIFITVTKIIQDNILIMK